MFKIICILKQFILYYVCITRLSIYCSFVKMYKINVANNSKGK
jgi:hypothetical protein